MNLQRMPTSDEKRRHHRQLANVDIVVHVSVWCSEPCTIFTDQQFMLTELCITDTVRTAHHINNPNAIRTISAEYKSSDVLQYVSCALILFWNFDAI